MRTRLALAAALVAAACAPAPTTGELPAEEAAYLNGNPYRLLGLDELPVVAITVDSEAAGLVKARDEATQWGSGGYKDPEAWLQLAFDQSYLLDHVELKTGALPAGASYRLVAWDGTGYHLLNTQAAPRAYTIEASIQRLWGEAIARAYGAP